MSGEAGSKSPYRPGGTAILGYLSIIVFAVGFAVWSVAMPLAGAVIASGQIVVEGNLRRVQHLQGGIVAEIKARDGDLVQAGDLLLRLDATQARATLGIISRQMDELSIRAARLIAERDGLAELVVPPDLVARLGDPPVETLVSSEKRLFEARRSAREGLRGQLRKRTGQLRSEIEGLTEQRSAKSRESQMISRELIGVRDLFQRNLVQIQRLSALEREAASLDGQHGQLTAQIAQSEGRISEVELQMLQIDEDLRSEALRDLREAQARLSELAERRLAAEDLLQRIDIRAPAAGIIHQSAVHTVGGVVPPGETLMLVVPAQEVLHVEARVAPMEVDQVRVGQPARIKVLAFNQRTTPELIGEVVRVAADVTREQQTGLLYFVVRIAVPPEELKRLEPFRITAGLQAESFIQTGERSAATFLLQPLTDQLARAFRER
jgi:HlyD family secretion protein